MPEGDDLIRPLCGLLPHPGEGNTGCRPPFAENSALHFFPGAPGPQPGEGNTGCRPPYAENNALHFFRVFRAPVRVECLQVDMLRTRDGATTSSGRFAATFPNPGKATRAAARPSLRTFRRNSHRNCGLFRLAARKTS